MSTCLIFLKIVALKQPVISMKIIYFPEKVTITINVGRKTSREEAWIPILLLTYIYVMLQVFVFSLPGFVRLQFAAFAAQVRFYQAFEISMHPDGFTNNTHGYFASCVVFFRTPSVLEKIRAMNKMSAGIISKTIE